jgi:HK97 family phage major capsid protein
MAAQIRSIVETAEKENRALTAEEQANYDKGFTEQDELRQTIERAERQQELDAELATAVDQDGGVEARGGRGAEGDREDRRRESEECPAEYRGNAALERAWEQRGSRQYNADFRRFLQTGEIRSLSAGTDSEGGYTVVPMQFADGLLKAIDNLVFIRQRATKDRVERAEKLGILTLEADPADADWTSELLTGNEDSSMAFGRREMEPHPLAKRIKVSNKLMRQSSRGIEGIVMQRLAYKNGVSQEKAFLTGDGSGKPLGVFTASASGIPSSRDVSTSNTATAVTMDGLISAKFALKAGYLANAVWMFHRDAVAMISKLKDSNNQYLWQPSTQVGQPDRLLGVPVIMSEYAPNTFTAGLYAGIIGDFSYYHIADALDMQIQRLTELYAETNQTGFISRLETDGQPTLGEAFARVTLAAS